MEKEDAKYILEAIEWMNANTTVASVDMETYGNLFMNSQSLLMDIVNGAEKSDTQALNLPVVINWVACSERLPEGALGSYMACLENNTVHKLQYSDITKHWWDIAMGDIRPHNPVKYWAELPEPPCL